MSKGGKLQHLEIWVLHTDMPCNRCTAQIYSTFKIIPELTDAAALTTLSQQQQPRSPCSLQTACRLEKAVKKLTLYV